MPAFFTAVPGLALSLLLGPVAAGERPAYERARTVPTLPSFSLAAFPPREPVLLSTQETAAASPSSSSVRKHPWVAAAEVAGVNFTYWAILHYVVGDVGYSFLSWETIRDNIRDGFEWDRSRYYSNFYHHPFHGSLYFNAGRANGLTYWESALAAFGGSLMWEVAMEIYRPAYNDLITTTFGGSALGEVGYRFSALLRRTGSRGLEWVWRETAAFVFDPVGAANRLFGNSRQDEPGLPRSRDAARVLDGEILLAFPVVARDEEVSSAKSVPLVAFDLDYGDPAGADWLGRPFDIFTVRGQVRGGPDRPHLSLFIHGPLFGKRIGAAESTSHFFGLYNHYEYYGFDSLRIAGTSFTAGWALRFELSDRVRLTATARLGWLAFGAVEDFYADPGVRTGYNYGTGLTASADLAFQVKGHEYLSAVWRHYGVHALAVRGDPPGHETWDVFHGRVSVPVWKALGAGFMVEYCRRHFEYSTVAPGSRKLAEGQAFVTCQF